MKVWNVIEESTDPYEGSDSPIASYFEEDHAVLHVLLLEQDRDTQEQTWFRSQTWRVDEDWIEETEPRLWEWWVGLAGITLNADSGEELPLSFDTPWTRGPSAVRMTQVSVDRPERSLVKPSTNHGHIQGSAKRSAAHWIEARCIAETEAEAVAQVADRLSKAVADHRARLAKKKVSFS